MVSVIIPCHNAAPWLPETLASLEGQRHLSEVILVDDASVDDTAKVAKKYNFLPLRVIPNSARGVSSARNTGLFQAKSEWVQFLDADDILMPGKLARQLSVGIKNNAEVVYGCWQIYQEQENSKFLPQSVVFPDYSGDLIARLLGANNFCQIGAMLFSRQAVMRVGGFNPRMQCVEDVNLYLRLAIRGVQFAKDTSGEICLLYRKHKTHKSLGSRDHLAFHAGCLTNAILAETFWQEETSEIRGERLSVLLGVYGQVARFYFEHDRPKFYQVIDQIHNLNPKYIPSGPRILRQLSACLGYEKAEKIALIYRQLKRKLKKA